MFFTLVSRIPGRVRLRCGAYLFDEESARGVAHLIMEVEGVSHAEVHPANGSILIVCLPTSEDAALACVRGLDVLALPTAEAGIDPASTAIEIARENNRFALEAGRLVAWRIARWAFLPPWLQSAWVVYRALGFLARGVKCLLAGKLTVEVLDATAIWASILRGRFTDAGAIIFLLQLSSILERHVQSRAHLALMANIVVRAKTAWQVVDGQDVQIPTTGIERGMVLHVATGSALPVDGMVLEGEAEIDESSMTGEAALVHKRPGSSVYAGTAIEDGDLKVEVVSPPGTARIDQIVSMVEESSNLKASIQGTAERLADGLVPYSFLAFFSILGITRSLSKAMTLLMVDYSCAIRLSTSVAVMSALNEASRNDIVVKGGKYFEALARADTIVFDKTGTLTHAEPQVELVMSMGGIPEDELLRYAACIEEHFPHSVARAIVREAQRRGLSHERELHARVTYIVAHGISTRVSGHPVSIGSAHFIFEDEGVPLPDGLFETLGTACPAASPIFISFEGSLAGVICISDPVRSEAARVLDRLRDLGFEQIVMLTGDSPASARHVADQLGIDVVRAQVLPEDKSRHVRELRDAGHVVAMVGDGINDSPALAEADVSLAMADASDVARAVADISLTSSSLESLVTARELSCALMERIHRGFRVAVAFNSGLIALGVAGLVSNSAAAWLHNGSTFVLTAASARRLGGPGNGEGRHTVPGQSA